MKKLVSLTLILLLCLSLVIPCAALSGLPRLVDDAGLLNQNEADSLLSQLDSISEKQQADIVVLTVTSLNGKSAEAYADDFYDQNGYGFGSDNSGVLLLLAMSEREYHISTTGQCISALSDWDLNKIGEEVASYLSAGRYADGFSCFARLCDSYLTAEDSQTYGPSVFPWQQNLLIALIVGLVLALIITAVMKGKLKSVRHETAAASYVNPGSLNLTVSRDMFLYSQLSRHPRPKDNPGGRSGGSTTHISSSGVHHGGSGGHF